MEKFLLDVLQLVILVRAGYSLLRWSLSPKKRKKSIAAKTWKLISRKIHCKLDHVLKKQKEVSYSSHKVIPINKVR